MKSAASREVNEIRAQYEARFLSAWARSDELFGLIRDDRLLAKLIVWRHPFLFYVGHLPAFSWNQICGAILKWQSLNPHFDELFAGASIRTLIPVSVIGTRMFPTSGRP
jgi:hypothetical protein